MQKFSSYFLLSLFFLFLTAFNTFPEADGHVYKCMIQMTNYPGEGAYVAVSVLDKDHNYLKTLHVMGDDPEWQEDLTSWFGFFSKNEHPDIDAISGETRAGGERIMFMVEIEDELIDAGNFLRLESAVENQKYVEDEILVPLTSGSLSDKIEGSEYIRYVRFIPAK
ncbi:DUF2271 domain-containing protein [Robertkochia solimangrovi]|uniref:DUF2271 domain-containing protein n=1 Tax=Robertkochia solimangrovi TaxID=2213046 RepID=UPI0011811F31|nr:DUF2271 domain-containing protein [Robertkochia solimangrovi]TRZ41174.1 DUF2271 domain-containing protein [Robertkochia solimangrovi]